MARKPRPITIARHARPETCRIAWTAEPKPHAITGNVKPEDKERALQELRTTIQADGYDPSVCEIVWTRLEMGWGWVARVREGEAA